jgi:hypothetical protein
MPGCKPPASTRGASTIVDDAGVRDSERDDSAWHVRFAPEAVDHDGRLNEIRAHLLLS